MVDDAQRTVPYAPHFPRPRTERVTPGNLVALAVGGLGPDVVVWRWFDAVVLAATGAGLSVWEPGHGIVDARPRDTQHLHRAGGRVYLSAGLPGAEWWAAGPAVDRPDSADVELDAVREFLISHGLWDHAD